tara:strand:- start:38 stop:379 length:342 start_codon:yes stop_codon:yes gene_type:complete
MRMAQLQATAPIVCCAGMYVESGGFDACDPVFNWVVVTLDGNPIMIVLKGFREIFAWNWIGITTRDAIGMACYSIPMMLVLIVIWGRYAVIASNDSVPRWLNVTLQRAYYLIQ